MPAEYDLFADTYHSEASGQLTDDLGFYVGLGQDSVPPVRR